MTIISRHRFAGVIIGELKLWSDPGTVLSLSHNNKQLCWTPGKDVLTFRPDIWLIFHFLLLWLRGLSFQPCGHCQSVTLVTLYHGDSVPWWLCTMVTLYHGDSVPWWLCTLVTLYPGDSVPWWLCTTQIPPGLEGVPGQICFSEKVNTSMLSQLCEFGSLVVIFLSLSLLKSLH